ncbi:MAG: TolC family protein [bacterium]
MAKTFSFVLFIGLFFLMAVPCKSFAEELIEKGEVLSLEKCIGIALKKNPTLDAAKNTILATQSRVGQAKSNYYPQVDWTSGYRKIYSGTTTTNTGIPVGGTQVLGAGSSSADKTSDQYSSSVTLSQNVYDFGKTSTQVKIQNFNLDSSRSDFENAIEQITFNVKQAYYGVLQAERSRDVAAETVKQFVQHLDQAKGFYTVGTKPKFDVTKAESDLSSAKLNLIHAENAVKLAMVNLNNAMGIPYAPEYRIEDNLLYEKYDITFESALERAYQDRPDIKSIVGKNQAAMSSVDLARKGYYPSLTGNASYFGSGDAFPLDRGWYAGASLSFPIFNGFMTKYQVDEARGNLNVLKANEESLRQTVFLDVQQSYLNLKEAEERIPTAELNVKQAEENFEIANGRYKAGVGNPIEVTDAEVGLMNAKTAYIQALYDYKVARASLENAMGER